MKLRVVIDNKISTWSLRHQAVVVEIDGNKELAEDLQKLLNEYVEKKNYHIQ